MIPRLLSKNLHYVDVFYQLFIMHASLIYVQMNMLNNFSCVCAKQYSAQFVLNRNRNEIYRAFHIYYKATLHLSSRVK